MLEPQSPSPPNAAHATPADALAAETSVPAAPQARRPWRMWLALIVYATIAWLVYRGIDRERFSLGFHHLRAQHMVIIIAMALVHIATRALRFDRLMRSARAQHYRLRDGIRVFLFGLSASAVTPGRAGDLIKARLVRDYGVGLNRGFGLVLVERVLDLLVIFSSMVAAGAILSGRASSDAWRAAALALLGCLVAGIVVLISPRLRNPLLRLAAKLLSRVVRSLREEQILSHLTEVLTVWDDVFHAPLRFLGYLAASILAWGVEFTKLWVVLRCLGVQMDIVFAFFVYPTSIVAGLLSLLPMSDAVVGVTGAVLLHKLAGIDDGLATTAIVVDRVVSVIPPLLLWGFFSLGKRGGLNLAPDSKP